MITGIGHLTLLVKDQEAAAQFYCDVLGLEKRYDHTMSNGFRWLTVAPRGQNVEITLVKADTPEKLARVGSQVANHVYLVLHTDDCRAEYERLGSKGVQFVSPPTERPWGTEALFLDLYGNVLDLLELH